MKLQFSILVGALILSGNVFAQSLSKLWTVSDGLKTPESVLFDEKTNSIYVANIDGQASEKDGNGFISILSPDGKIKNLKWITGLNAPKGQAIFKNNLYVADIDELIVISIRESKIIKRYKAEKAIFLNDVTATDDGTIFVSDTRDNKVYILENEKLSVWSDNPLLKSPNGLWAENGFLYIGTGQILKANPKTKAMEPIVDECGGIDGLEKMSDGNFVYSNWKGLIFVTKGKQSIKLLDTVDQQNTADIDFIPGKNVVLVPTFLGNSVDAYLLKP